MTPDNTILVVLIAAACIYLTIFSWPISYPQMVFWLNIGFVMVYARLGAQVLGILFARPVTTLLGALVAALVVVYLFPIHTTDRFKAAVTRFLGAVDAYVAAFVDAMSTGGGADSGAQPLDAAQAKVAAAYAQVEQTLPGVAFENSPLLQAQSPIAQRATQIAALDAEATRLAGAAAEHAALADDAAIAPWMHSMQERIHRDIQTLVQVLSGAPKNAPFAAPAAAVTLTAVVAQGETVAPPAAGSWQLTPERLADRLQADGQGQFRTGDGPALIRIQGIIAQLNAELGAPTGRMSA